MTTLRLSGLGVALATPLLPDGELDLPGIDRLTRHVATNGADFLVALGSTGEAATLDDDERDRVLKTILAASRELPVIVGLGGGATRATIRAAEHALGLGVQGALVVVPPYTKPTQPGLAAHFEAVAAATPELPLVLYNVPSRTGANLAPATLQRLWERQNIVAIKESSGDLAQITRIANDLPAGKTLLAGDDALALATIAVGGHGLVSVAGNLVPGRMQDLVSTALSNDFVAARDQLGALLPLFDALTLEPNPIPVKTALELLGLAGPTLRLPLQNGNVATREALRRALAHQREVIHG
ncbi:MAG: 4-hydroxy-tetrahydrodipicolinate synthase [bacterium]|nr:4-hydroxy-tetrahydrodipicolinate synthase [bacterium]